VIFADTSGEYFGGAAGAPVGVCAYSWLELSLQLADWIRYSILTNLGFAHPEEV
jgi:hypothetical protein